MPEAGEVVARDCGVEGEGDGDGAGECCSEDVKWLGEGVGLSGGSWAVASGSWCRVAVGVSTNIIEGPGASSLATAVRGTGLEENLGRDSGSRITGAREEVETCEVESCDVLLAVLRAFL